MKSSKLLATLQFGGFILYDLWNV